MRKRYRASVFASFYYGVLLLMAGIWFCLLSHVPHGLRPWGTLLLLAFGILGAPSIWARVTIDDDGIEQRFLKRWSVAWKDIIAWQRTGSEDDDCDDTITIDTRRGPFALNGNCVYGKRLVEVEAELRRRVGQAQTPPESVR